MKNADTFVSCFLFWFVINRCLSVLLYYQQFTVAKAKTSLIYWLGWVPSTSSQVCWSHIACCSWFLSSSHFFFTHCQHLCVGVQSVRVIDWCILGVGKEHDIYIWDALTCFNMTKRCHHFPLRHYISAERVIILIPLQYVNFITVCK